MTSSPSGASPPARDERLRALVAHTEGLQPWRRVLHASTGLIIAGLLRLLDPPWTLAVGGLGGLALLLFLSDLVRLRAPILNRLFFRLLRPLASPREATGPASSSWYIAGCFLAVLIFPRDVAVAAILVLALADPVASYIGRRWGRRPFGAGTVEGSAVFTIVAFLVLLPFAGWFVAGVSAPLVAWVERLRWPLDDNLTVPLVTGLLLWSLLPHSG